MKKAAPATDEEALPQALGFCYGQLARREHSVAELRARLVRAGVAEQTIEQAIAIVSEQGYLSDARYAQLLAQDRRRLDGWGVARIRERLERAGVERELIETTLAGFDSTSERTAAVELLRRRLVAPPANDRERQRAFGILIRQGFESEVAYDAIRELGRHDTETASSGANQAAG